MISSCLILILILILILCKKKKHLQTMVGYRQVRDDPNGSGLFYSTFNEKNLGPHINYKF
jgi:hypothetical protein